MPKVQPKKREVEIQGKSSFDWDQYNKTVGTDNKRRFVTETIQTGYVSISDMFANLARGGHAVLHRLEVECKKNSERGDVRKWKIKCMKHRDGKEAKPGDRIEWIWDRHNRLDYGEGRKIGVQEKNDMIRRGDGHLIEERGYAILDERCCFDATYREAADLLSKWGVYYLSGKPLSPYPEITKGGVHKWRYIEVPPGLEDLLAPLPEPEPVQEPDPVPSRFEDYKPKRTRKPRKKPESEDAKPVIETEEGKSDE